jgi:ankyrin
MVEMGADIDTFTMGVTPLHLAAQYNRLDVAQVLVENGAKLDLLTYHDGSTALYYASGHGYAEMVDLLLRAGASVSVKQKRSGGFPLLYASMTGDARIVKMLLAAGAVIDDAGDDGLRPVHAAAAIGSATILDVLLKYEPTQKVKAENPSARWGLELLLSPGKRNYVCVCIVYA